MRIAIVGSGVSGLAATWALNEFSEHEVNLYESGDYIGGHTHTVLFERDGKEPIDVDTGFIVCNPPTYPNFLSFLSHNQIPTLPTTMTFSISRDSGFFEWAGGLGFNGLFCQLRNLGNPRVYRMVWDVIRFNLFALDLIDDEEEEEEEENDDVDVDVDVDESDDIAGTGQTKGRDIRESKELSIGEYLEREGYSDAFKEDYLLPMTAAIWSTPADKCALDFPARTLVRFFHNHHLMQVTGKPKWLTVKGGSKLYVDSIINKLPDVNLHLNTKIQAITPRDDQVVLVEENGTIHEYDHVIIATHSDTTLQMLENGGGPTVEEEEILGSFEWSKNEAVLHWDQRFMPIRRKAWSAWNYLTSSKNPIGNPSTAESSVNTVSLTYGMNDLQHLPRSRHGDVFLTLNPPFEVDEKKTVGRWKYEHPMYSAKSVQAQHRLPEIQNQRRMTFAGAWTNYGFHEDGFTSGLKIAVNTFGAKCPFPILPAARSIEQQVIARAVVAYAESGRRWLAESVVWYYFAWGVVVALLWLEQVMAAVGMEDWGKEVNVVRGFWVDREGRVGGRRR